MFLKFPYLLLLRFTDCLYAYMKEKIIERANDMFLSLGFKSVTMDDLASEMGISKKTIYTHFQNKTKLVEATTEHLFCEISEGIDAILAEKREPIEELFAIKAFVIQQVDWSD